MENGTYSSSSRRVQEWGSCRCPDQGRYPTTLHDGGSYDWRHRLSLLASILDNILADRELVETYLTRLSSFDESLGRVPSAWDERRSWLEGILKRCVWKYSAGINRRRCLIPIVDADSTAIDALKPFWVESLSSRTRAYAERYIKERIWEWRLCAECQLKRSTSDPLCLWNWINTNKFMLPIFMSCRSVCFLFQELTIHRKATMHSNHHPTSSCVWAQTCALCKLRHSIPADSSPPRQQQQPSLWNLVCSSSSQRIYA